MARSIPVIYNQLLAAKNAQSNLNALNSNSQVAIWRLILWIVAVGQNLFEQLCDLFQTNMEVLISGAPTLTAQWIVQACKYFQYNISNPQVPLITVTNTYPFVSIVYPVVNSLYNVVAQASVTSNTNGQLLIKVAGAGPAPLDGAPGISGPQCMALQTYLNTVLPPNYRYNLINNNADQILIDAQIFFNAAYSGVIVANVQAAINNYLASIPFNGVFTVSALEEAILAVAGVNDILFANIYWRRATDPVPPASENMLISNQLLISRNYQTYAGYVISEQTSGYTLANTITYTAS